jgi:hypothetical protein
VCFFFSFFCDGCVFQIGSHELCILAGFKSHPLDLCFLNN